MPVYEYGCTKDKSHERVLVTHGMTEFIGVFCPECGQRARRVPQGFRWGWRAQDRLIDRVIEKGTRNGNLFD